MAHTYSSLYTHAVFATYNRTQLILPAFEADLYAYMNGIVHNIGGRTLAINGMPEHIHMLLELPPRIALADALMKVKTNSSSWVHDKHSRGFGWQRGYGGFSVSRSNVDAVVNYIAEQKEHHKKWSFEDEYLGLLKAHGVAFDPKYLWR